ncbi:hypothetical protein ACFQ6N_29400 [Kitasatospora sp. NPDC056446]|uniref:hypothetical protein n=1 Tax=Kitasatospora sp. NPDC056446 TaxID=3345819 RepID=UPI0036C41699
MGHLTPLEVRQRHQQWNFTDDLLPDPAGLREQLEDIDDDLAQHTGPDPDPEDTGLRLTPLDPKRPAPALLEDRLAGIHGCWLLHEEHDELDGEDGFGGDADRDGEHTGQPGIDRNRFARLVREAAAAHRDRLV